MGTRIEFTEDNLGVILHHDGVILAEEVIDSLVEVYDDSRYPHLKYWIGDFTKGEIPAPNPEYTQRIVQLNIQESQRNPGMLLAIVAETDLTFAIARMFQAYNESSAFNTHVFRNRKLAEEWILSNLKKD